MMNLLFQKPLSPKRSSELGSPGHTLVELVVALTLVALVSGLSFQGLRFTKQRISKWQSRIAMELAAQRIATAISRELRLSRELLTCRESQLTFLSQDKKKVTYSNRQRSITRNSRSLLPAGDATARLHFEYLTAEGEAAREESDRKIAPHIVFRVSVQAGDGAGFELWSRIARRNRRSEHAGE